MNESIVAFIALAIQLRAEIVFYDNMRETERYIKLFANDDLYDMISAMILSYKTCFSSFLFQLLN